MYKRQVKDALYWFVSDYTDLTVTWRVREGLDPGLSFAREIVMDSDLSSPGYLYQLSLIHICTGNTCRCCKNIKMEIIYGKDKDDSCGYRTGAAD